MEIYESFKSIKSQQNNKYGGKNTCNIGKNYSNRSFGGGMSNRKYTKEQVKPHKLTKSTSKITNNIKSDATPPVYPISNASSRKDYRTGYLNEDLSNPPKKYDKYYKPSQNIKLDKKQKKDKSKIQDKDIQKINIINKNINDNSSLEKIGSNGNYNDYNDFNGINNGYNWYWNTYGYPNWYNPYYFGSYLPWMPPYQDDNIIIMDNENSQEDIQLNNFKRQYEREKMHGYFIFIIVVLILFLILILKK